MPTPPLPSFCTSLAGILAGIVLDGTVGNCNGPTSSGVHTRRTSWQGSANLFVRNFGQSTQRGLGVGKVHFATNIANGACHTCQDIGRSVHVKQPLGTSLPHWHFVGLK